jgi:hypothetical protein
MKLNEAIQILTDATGQLKMSRADHETVIQALNRISEELPKEKGNGK